MLDTISVIIPSYNESEIIPETLNVMLRQVSPLEEIIVVDDGSPDNTSRIVQDLAKDNPKIRLIKRGGLARGLVSAIREGIDNAKGDWVFWLDADFSDTDFSLRRL
ncbi:MAG TPA: glycosyltransferase family 2 protein, partial [Candidatus Omnitrophota bacterium]|nr:glycosyltransferase family 2 protein [Candidatus Omnitrophota bacterium]